MSDGRTVKSSDLIARKHKRRKTKEAPSGGKETSLAAAIQETKDSVKSKSQPGSQQSHSQQSSVKPPRITAVSKPSKYNKPGKSIDYFDILQKIEPLIN